MDDDLIWQCATAARIACLRMTPHYLKALHDSVGQAGSLPAGWEWDRKATVHAEIFNVLTDAAGDPVLAVLLANATGRVHDLMVTVGPVADGIILSSRRRMLALMRAGDADGVAREMDQHIRGLLFMRRLSRGSAPNAMAV
jgi:DNA-binding GntR family transcriptional regulator